LVERWLPKPKVAGSRPVVRFLGELAGDGLFLGFGAASKKSGRWCGSTPRSTGCRRHRAGGIRVAELADALGVYGLERRDLRG